VQAFLRWLDELAVVSPARSAGGQRRYSRRQISGVLRARELAGVRQVLALEDQIRQLEASLAAARAETARLRAEHDRMPARRSGRRQP